MLCFFKQKKALAIKIIGDKKALQVNWEVWTKALEKEEQSQQAITKNSEQERCQEMVEKKKLV